MKKHIKIIAIVLCIILIIGIAAVAIFLKSKLSKINYEDVTPEDIKINEGIEEELKDYTNIAILGLDKKDETFDYNRSDCIIIISINNNTKDVNLVSVYRDTYLQIEDHGLDKITHAYAYNKAPLALSTINTNMDLNITKYVTISFDSVIEIIDAIGGVTLDISSAEATQIKGINSAGTYNLNGTQALTYGRIRKIDSDYARTERMRTVLIKFFEKAKALPYGKLNALIDQTLPCVSTNISQTDILTYASKINQYNIKKSFGWPYDIKEVTLDAWYGVPDTLESNVKQLHEDLFEIENYEVSDKVKMISQEIIDSLN